MAHRALLTRLLVPPAPLEELTAALKGHDDAVVRPLLAAAETIVVSRFEVSHKVGKLCHVFC